MIILIVTTKIIATTIIIEIIIIVVIIKTVKIENWNYINKTIYLLPCQFIINTILRGFAKNVSRKCCK